MPFLIPLIPLAVAGVGLAAGIISVGTFALAAIGVGLSFVANTLLASDAAESAKENVGGVQIDLRADSDVPQSLIVGRAVTAGSLVAPPWTYGKRGDIDNSDMIQIISLADHPCHGLVKVILEDREATYSLQPEFDLTAYMGMSPFAFAAFILEGWVPYGFNGESRGYLIGGYNDKLAFLFYNGTQQNADALSVVALAAHPERPWTSAHVGRGRTYVRLHYIYDRELVPGLLRWRFVVDGIKLYDPRLDTTAGGSGSHRFNDLDTHEFTTNLAVIAYNILRGIRVKDSGGTPRHFYGLENTAASQLPLDSWFAAMNECDVVVDGEYQFHGGAEITLDTPPIDAIGMIVRACAGRFTETGGVYKLRVGAPGLPVISITDEDLRANEGDEFRPILPQESRVNYVAGKFTSPDDGWLPKVAVARTDDDMLALDGRRLTADLDVPMVQSPLHMQRLQQQLLLRSRQQRRHSIPLPPEFFGLEPGDVVEWNSERNGYIDKLFEIDSPTWLPNLDSTIDITETDPADYDWDIYTDYVEQDVVSLVVDRPDPKIIEGFDADGLIHTGDNGVSRPAILVTWDDPEDDDLASVLIEVRRASQPDEVATFPGLSPTDESALILAGLAPSTEYEVRGRFVSFNGYAVNPSLWIPVTTPDVRLSYEELEDRLQDRINAVSRIEPKLLQISADVERAAIAAATASLMARAEASRIEGDMARVFRDTRIIVDSLNNTALAEEISIIEARVQEQLAQVATLTASIATLEASAAGIIASISALSGQTTALLQQLRLAGVGDLRRFIEQSAIAAAAASILAERNMSSVAGQIDYMKASVRDNVAQITIVTTALASADSALAQSIVELTASTTNAITGVQSRATALETITAHATSGNAALAARTSVLEGSVNDPTTGLNARARITAADSTDVTFSNGSVVATSLSVLNLESEILDPTTGAIAVATNALELYAETTADDAIAGYDQTIFADSGAGSASGHIRFVAASGPPSGVAASYRIELRAAPTDGWVALVGLALDILDAGGNPTQARLYGDQVKIATTGNAGGDVVFETGTRANGTTGTIIKSLHIGLASVDSLHLINAAVTSHVSGEFYGGSIFSNGAPLTLSYTLRVRGVNGQKVPIQMSAWFRIEGHAFASNQSLEARLRLFNAAGTDFRDIAVVGRNVGFTGDTNQWLDGYITGFNTTFITSNGNYQDLTCHLIFSASGNARTISISGSDSRAGDFLATALQSKS